jgi:uncharacterized membrane protein
MWHYVQNGQASAAIEMTALQSLLTKGSLGPDTLVWTQGMAQWLPARSVPDLAGSLPSAGGPPPIPPGAIPPLTMPPPPLPLSEEADIQQNKVFAVLAYIGILFLVPLLAAPNSKFARYHTNQGIVLFLSAVAVYFVLVVVLAMPLINLLTLPLHLVVPVLIFALMIIGIINAASGHYKPLPWIGHFRILT